MGRNAHRAKCPSMGRSVHGAKCPWGEKSINQCCLHSFYYISLDLLSLQRQHHLPWSESELTIPGTTFVPGNIRSRERKFPVTFFPRSESSRELSFLGANVPSGNFRSEERKYLGAKSPDTLSYMLLKNLYTSIMSPLTPRNFSVGNFK